jgi:hypothetical protein
MAIEWKTVPRTPLVVGTGAAVLFFIHAATAKGGFLIMDYVNLPIHEAGHLVFGVLGAGLGIWGGTLLELIIPLAFLAYFSAQTETTGAAFSAFWFGENFVYIAAYIADARAQELPLVGGGEHDWNTILSGMNMLSRDKTIADIVRFLGWLIMVGAVLWFVSKREKTEAD